jgi:hypothetical protein
MNATPDVFDDLALLAEAMFGGCRGGHTAACTCPTDDDLRCELEAELCDSKGRSVHVEEGWVTFEFSPTPRGRDDVAELERRAFRRPGVRGVVTHVTAGHGRPRARGTKHDS